MCVWGGVYVGVSVGGVYVGEGMGVGIRRVGREKGEVLGYPQTLPKITTPTTVMQHTCDAIHWSGCWVAWVVRCASKRADSSGGDMPHCSNNPGHNCSHGGWSPSIASLPCLPCCISNRACVVVFVLMMMWIVTIYTM